MTASDLDPIRQVLDEAGSRGTVLDIWWRDDDAVRHTPELDRLIQLSRQIGAPLALAVVPALLERSLVERLQDEAALGVLVHGFGHVNHEGGKEKAAEFGPARPLGRLEDDARQGLTLTRAAFPDRTLEVFVPPWNRASPELVPRLPQLGYRGISTYGPRPIARAGGLAIVNTHLDPVNWHGGRGALDPVELAAALSRAVAAARQDGSVEPIGLLTHHLMFDEDLWSYSTGLLDMLTGHPAVRFPSLAEVWRLQRCH